MKLNFKEQGKKYTRYWNTCVGAGRANEGLRAIWQDQLKQVVDTCGFKYLRFHGLFCDDMYFYKEVDGKPVYNFQYIDNLFDAMLDRGIRPFVELSFSPKELASNDNTVCMWRGWGSPPNDNQKWADLITFALNHWIERYGLEEVKQWYFEVWNEPNLDGFWKGTRSQYYELYKWTAKAIKAVNEDLRVGGPATSNFVPDTRFDHDLEDFSAHVTFKVDDINTLEWHGVWIEDFLAYCEREEIPVDFVSTHPYPTDFAFDNSGTIAGRTRYRDSLRDDLNWLKAAIAKSAYPNAEIHLTEWSTSPSSRDHGHDYLPAATYVMRANLQCIGLTDSLSYWIFTDIMEEAGAGPKSFHGGFGMITLQGVKKPVYHAYRMLNTLGDEILSEGEGYFFTKKDDRLSAVFYEYPDSFTDTVPMSVFPNQQIALDCQNYDDSRDYCFEVEGLVPGAEYTLQVLHRDDIAIHKWNEMGAPTTPTREQEKELRAQGEVLREQKFTVDENGVLKAAFTLDAWSIASLN